MKRLLVTCLPTILAVVLGVSGATAYFGTTGAGGATASIGGLGAPTINVANGGTGTATLAWPAVPPPSGGGPVTYYVTRDGASAGGNCPTSASPGTATSCIDSGLAAGTYHYTVIAVWRSWSAVSDPTAVTVASGPLDHFSLTAVSTTPTAGTADNLTITAEDASDNTVTTYSGPQTVTFSGAGTIGAYQPTVTSRTGSAVAFGTPESIRFTGGVATVSGSSNGVMVLYKAETANVTVSDGTHTGSLSVTVSAAGAASISATSGGGQSATVSTTFGNPLSATVSDTYGNLDPGASVTFSGPSSGASAAFASGGNCTGNPQTYQCVALTDASGVATSSAFTANASQGSYNISATASGGSNPSVNFGETNIGLLHVNSLVTGSTSGSTTWTGSVTVKVTNSAGVAVNGVSVTGAWSPTTTAAGGCTTDAFGQCTITPAAGAFPSGQLTETWTVSNLSLSGYSYAPASNIESAVTLSLNCAAATVCATSLTSASAFTDTTAGTSSSSALLSGTNTPPSGSTVLILIARDGSQSGDTVSGVTGSAIGNVTPVTSLTSNLSSKAGAFTNLWVYRARGTGTTTSPAVTVTFDKSDNLATLVQVIVLSGENTTAPIAQGNNTNMCTTGCTTTATATLPNPLATGSEEVVLVGEAANTGASMTSASWATKLFWARATGSAGANYGTFFGTSTASGTVTLGTANVWGALALEVARST